MSVEINQKDKEKVMYDVEYVSEIKTDADADHKNKLSRLIGRKL